MRVYKGRKEKLSLSPHEDEIETFFKISYSAGREISAFFDVKYGFACERSICGQRNSAIFRSQAGVEKALPGAEHRERELYSLEKKKDREQERS